MKHDLIFLTFIVELIILMVFFFCVSTKKPAIYAIQLIVVSVCCVCRCLGRCDCTYLWLKLHQLHLKQFIKWQCNWWSPRYWVKVSVSMLTFELMTVFWYSYFAWMVKLMSRKNYVNNLTVNKRYKPGSSDPWDPYLSKVHGFQFSATCCASRIS